MAEIHVMVVEDDPMVMEITCGYIQSIPGFSIAARAGSGSDALRQLVRCKVELLILDIYMPVMNGVELLRECRSRGIDADAIFLTAAKDKQMIDRALKLGAVDYLIKPFGYDRFKATLETYRHRYQCLHEQHREATQEEVDQLLGGGKSDHGQIQKGLHEKTLDYVRECVRSCESDLISPEDLMQQLAISKSTARRYLDYLASIGEVVLQIEYGTVGRPTYRYRRLR
ncbi:response regulator [Angelakisella massiliensis]|uniref:response regulator n=1 Tax=Angelakisella massiliensis TaxID=1871018 RepID=UPI0023A855A7|nr:response regulator [Angelakisella massiliensis]